MRARHISGVQDDLSWYAARREPYRQKGNIDHSPDWADLKWRQEVVLPATVRLTSGSSTVAFLSLGRPRRS